MIKMKIVQNLESKVKNLWKVVSNPNEHPIEIYFGTMITIIGVLGAIIGIQQAYDFVNRETIARDHDKSVAVKVGYEFPDHIRKVTHFDPPVGQEKLQCGEGYFLTLDDETQLRYEIMCAYEPKEIQN